MGSDEDYASFLDKANQDTGASASTQSKVGTKSVDTAVPKALESVEEYYTSEADEPFEPVSLKWDGEGLPDAGAFGKLIGKEAEIISRKDFDPQGSYKSVVDAVEKAGSKDVAFFSVSLGGTRTEFFVVSVDAKGRKLVGMKAVAVQS